MEKSSLFNGVGKYLIGPGFAALLTAAPVLAADGAPAQGDANAGNAHPETTLSEVRQLTQKFDTYANEIDSYARDLLKTGGALSPEEREWITSMKNDVASLQKEIKTMNEAPWYTNSGNLLALGLFALASGLTLGIYFLQKRAADSADKLNKETNEAVEEQKEILKKQESTLDELNASNEKTEDYIRRAEKLTYATKFSNQTQASGDHVDRTVRMLSKRMERNDRLGKFPDLLPYAFARLQTTRELAVLTIPFYMFGALGNPAALHEFHATLYEHFAAPQKAKLVIVIYDDMSRASLAYRRYSRGYDALRLMGDRAVTETFLKLFNDDIAESLSKSIDDYRRGLKREDRGRIYELAKIQMEREERDPVLGKRPARHPKPEDYETGDWEFHRHMILPDYIRPQGKSKNLSKKSDHELFKRVINLRRALGKAMQQQEQIYFGTEPWNPKKGGSPWPSNATVIKIDGTDRKLDNITSLFIDGKEVIEWHSDMSALEARGNKVVSKLGQQQLIRYNKDIKTIFKKNAHVDDSQKCSDIKSQLGQLIQKGAAYTSHEYELLKGIKAKLEHLF